MCFSSGGRGGRGGVVTPDLQHAIRSCCVRDDLIVGFWGCLACAGKAGIARMVLVGRGRLVGVVEGRGRGGAADQDWRRQGTHGIGRPKAARRPADLPPGAEVFRFPFSARACQPERAAWGWCGGLRAVRGGPEVTNAYVIFVVMMGGVRDSVTSGRKPNQSLITSVLICSTSSPPPTPAGDH